VVFVVLAALPVHAQIAVSANDTTEIMVDGVHVMVPNASPDTVTLIDLSARPPRVVAELNAPSSWSGPPQMVAVTPDESIALVASSLKANPADPAQTTQDNTVSVIALKSSPPAVIRTLEAGLFPNGIAINARGTLALVANRGDSTVSIYTISGTSVDPAGQISLRDRSCAPSMPAFTPDGATAYLTCTDTTGSPSSRSTEPRCAIRAAPSSRICVRSASRSRRREISRSSPTSATGRLEEWTR
jgi:DNA-binding beta-propeller fold protein YncE